MSILSSSFKTKHEICRNITAEIYKRIDITFAIKKLDNNDDSSLCSVDSNDISNETDMFAYTDTLSSSSFEFSKKSSEKMILFNNNEETKLRKLNPNFRKIKKRYRKRVKKKQFFKAQESDCSSDEAPLSKIVDTSGKPHEYKSELIDSNQKNADISNENSNSGPILLKIQLRNGTELPQKSPKQSDTVECTETSEVNTKLQSTNSDTISDTSNQIKTIRDEKSTTIYEKTEMSPTNSSSVMPTDDTQPSNVETASKKSEKSVFDFSDSDEKSEPMDLCKDGTKSKEKVKGERKLCPACKVTFCSEKGLRRHMKRSHAALAGNLDLHKADQQTDRAHACATCSKRFKRASDLRAHERTHDAHKPYSCAHCNTTFTRYDSWRRHQQRLHASPAPRAPPAIPLTGGS